MALLPGSLVCRSAVDDGSKPACEGVTKAFKFCTIESSIVALDIRRKAVLDDPHQPRLI